ncbi:MAG: hypothetical protein IJZ90_00195 [Clostridia bacterium]|nr:hypothetical protein [Clostridia bacterium]
MLQKDYEKVFNIISVVLVCIFDATVILICVAVPKENIAEFICLIALSLVSFVLSMALNAALLSVRKKDNNE